MQSRIWLSFDLGVRGDFEGIYQFLGERDAKECGSNMGSFKFNYKKDLATELKQQLKAAIKLDKRSRIYVIFAQEGRHVGRFVIGGRRSPPWASYIPSQDDEEEDIGE